MSFYSNLAATAKRLLDTYGQTVTINRTTGDSFNAVTGITTPGSPDNLTGSMAIFDYEVNLIDGINIQVGDMRGILESTNEPFINEVVTTADGNFNILKVKPLSPGGEVVIYELQLRS